MVSCNRLKRRKMGLVHKKRHTFLKTKMLFSKKLNCKNWSKLYKIDAERGIGNEKE